MPEITITNPHPVLRPLRPEGSPEYQKDYKPENNSGCGFKEVHGAVTSRVDHAAKYTENKEDIESASILHALSSELVSTRSDA